MSKAQRNAKCHCGSGRKFKHCHGAPGRPAPKLNRAVSRTVFALMAAVVLWGGYSLATADKTAAADGRVWSAEHNHWHDSAGGELGTSSGPGPTGPAPAGKVWSVEHNHWH